LQNISDTPAGIKILRGNFPDIPADANIIPPPGCEYLGWRLRGVSEYPVCRRITYHLRVASAENWGMMRWRINIAMFCVATRIYSAATFSTTG
jgi:hypothetical protein